MRFNLGPSSLVGKRGIMGSLVDRGAVKGGRNLSLGVEFSGLQNVSKNKRCYGLQLKCAFSC